MIELPAAEAHALATGAVVVAFVTRGLLTEGDEFEMASEAQVDADRIQPRFRGKLTGSAEVGDITAVVEAVHPAAFLDPLLGSECHVWLEPGEDDLVVLRVYGPLGPVIDNPRFEEMRSVVEGALRP